MARRGTSGWEIVGGLIGVGLAAGMAYTLHTKMQDLVNQLLACPLDEALETVAASVPPLEEEVWDLFAGALQARASQSFRARQLLSFANDVRNTAPHILRLLRLPGERAVHSVFELTLDLEEDNWQVFQLTLAGFAKSSADAEALLQFATRVRQAHVALHLLLEKNADERTGMLIRYTLDLDDDDWGLFRAVLAHFAKHSRVRELLELTSTTRELHNIVRQISTSSIDGAVQTLVQLAPQLDDTGWQLLAILLGQAAKSDPMIRLLLPTFEHLREAVAYADRLLMYPLDEAQRMLAAELRTRPDGAWPSLRIVLAVRGQSSPKAQRLCDYTEEVHRSIIVGTPLLGAPAASQEPAAPAKPPAQLAAKPSAPASSPADRTPAERQLAAKLRDILDMPRKPAEFELAQLIVSLDDPGWQYVQQLLGNHVRADHTLGSLATFAERVWAARANDERTLRSAVEELLAREPLSDDTRRTIGARASQLGLPAAVAERVVREVQQAQSERPAAEEQIRTRARAALADDIVTPEELADLHALRDELHVTTDLVDRILEEIREERASRPGGGATPTLPNWITGATTAPSADDLFRQNLRTVLSDNVITPQEGAALEELRQQLQLSTERAQQLLHEVQSEYAG